VTKDQFLVGVVEQPSGCWYRGTGTARSQIFHEGRGQSGARVAWSLFRGPIAPGLKACHQCDHPRCVNPDHLFLGTHAENMDDRGRKGRVSRPKTSGTGTTKRDRGTAYLLERLPPQMWADVKTRAAKEGHALRWIILKLLDYYAKHGLPK